jgi:DNA polymerase III sliding clamp (beta) subunit (PCNA family)
MSEDLDRSAQHRYTVTGSREKDILINIQITSGNLRVRATDFGAIDVTETNMPGSRNIHITVPAKSLAKN